MPYVVVFLMSLRLCARARLCLPALHIRCSRVLCMSVSASASVRGYESGHKNPERVSEHARRACLCARVVLVPGRTSATFTTPSRVRANKDQSFRARAHATYNAAHIIHTHAQHAATDYTRCTTANTQHACAHFPVSLHSLSDNALRFLPF